MQQAARRIVDKYFSLENSRTKDHSQVSESKESVRPAVIPWTDVIGSEGLSPFPINF
jgi:hypothetical protein